MCAGKFAQPWYLVGTAPLSRIAHGAFLSLVLVALLAPLPALAQQPPLHRVGALSFFSHEVDGHLVEAFQQRLNDLGWVEGRTVSHEIRFAGGRPERLPDLAAELLRLRVSVIFAGGDLPVAALKRAGATVPIVFAAVSDPVALGFVASLARPGGNITGVSLMSVELSAKRLELLKEAVPGATRVGILANPTHPLFEPMVRAVTTAAPFLRLHTTVYEVTAAAGLEAAFTAMARERVDAVLGLPGQLFFNERVRLAEIAARHRIPGVFGVSEMARAGGLVAYAANVVGQVRRAAELVDRILRGARPADLPVEQPVKFDLVINLKTAKALGLTIPQSLLIRADEIIR